MRSKRLHSIGIATAILLSSIALGAAPAGAGDGPSLDYRGGPSFDHHDGPSLDDHQRPAFDGQVRGVGDPSSVGVGEPPSLPSRAAANATTATRAEPVAPDSVVMDVQVYENGTATWQVVYRTDLDDPETAAAFRDYADDVENNSERYSRQFVERMNSTVRSAEQFTGREMRGTDYSVRAELHEFPQRYGVVTYSFEWQGFANVSDDRVRVGDALSGLVLDETTRLRVEWPEGYDPATIRSTPETGFEERERAVVWSGPLEFSSDEPRVVLTAPGAGGPDERSRAPCDRMHCDDV